MSGYCSPLKRGHFSISRTISISTILGILASLMNITGVAWPQNVSFCVIFALELLLRAVAYRKNFLMGEAWSGSRMECAFESHNLMTKKEAELQFSAKRLLYFG